MGTKAAKDAAIASDAQPVGAVGIDLIYLGVFQSARIERVYSDTA